MKIRSIRFVAFVLLLTVHGASTSLAQELRGEPKKKKIVAFTVHNDEVTRVPIPNRKGISRISPSGPVGWTEPRSEASCKASGTCNEPTDTKSVETRSPDTTPATVRTAGPLQAATPLPMGNTEVQPPISIAPITKRPLGPEDFHSTSKKEPAFLGPAIAIVIVGAIILWRYIPEEITLAVQQYLRVLRRRRKKRRRRSHRAMPMAEPDGTHLGHHGHAPIITPGHAISYRILALQEGASTHDVELKYSHLRHVYETQLEDPNLDPDKARIVREQLRLLHDAYQVLMRKR